MSLTDPRYLEEIEREKSLKMATCRCSNCDPQAAARLIRLLPQTNLTRLDQLMSSSPTDPEDISLFDIPKTSSKRKITSSIPLVCKSNDPIRLNVPIIDLVISNDQEILDTQIIEEEHREELRLKAVEKENKAKDIANQKLLRIEKAAEAASSKEKKITDKQKKVSDSLNL
ncbi:uncharacterized protein MELLADRAFT_63590 [Melampsora larici-populina 98AG31]|uniref:Uncharacterized protein n=1 Tax=Melampsora larici-populina (strain 98AG31 / pathotype 3-4-7) TaxID=747676 RepID=F4RN75_MELLP|nr:uncharacterized protein MELLADRAFT_63590 [Melampsora larici-populina 98AG31]EGG06267.1 hypothetical protein MELLADRAFT_63590 [Melampsora larici-populina 98AG31]